MSSKKDMESVWHVYSDGTRTDIPFNTEEDKVYAWNSVAVSALIAGVRILVSTVNDTHFHTLAVGEELHAERYRRILKQRLSRRFANIFLTCDLIPSRDEILSKFMYVYRNCLDFYKNLPGEYPWGAGHLYFSELSHSIRGREISELTVREQRSLFVTRHPLPPHWRYDPVSLRILPENFIDFRYVENLFGTVRAFIAFQYVRKEDEAAMKQEVHRHYLESRTIQDLRRIGNRYAKNYCGHTLTGSPLNIRLKVASRMLKEGLSGRSPSLAKALLLQPDDLRFLV